MRSCSPCIVVSCISLLRYLNYTDGLVLLRNRATLRKTIGNPDRLRQAETLAKPQSPVARLG